MTHHFELQYVYTKLITMITYLYRKNNSETKNRDIENFMFFFSKWRQSDRKWSKVVLYMTKCPNYHFWPYFRKKSYSRGILKQDKKNLILSAFDSWNLWAAVECGSEKNDLVTDSLYSSLVVSDGPKRISSV